MLFFSTQNNNPLHQRCQKSKFLIPNYKKLSSLAQLGVKHTKTLFIYIYIYVCEREREREREIDMSGKRKKVKKEYLNKVVKE